MIDSFFWGVNAATITFAVSFVAGYIYQEILNGSDDS